MHFSLDFVPRFQNNDYLCSWLVKYNNMLDKEFKYYLDHQEELLPIYNGKYVMIVGNKVVGACNSIGEAYYKGKREYGLGNFLVQLCTPGDSAYTVTYHTRYK